MSERNFWAGALAPRPPKPEESVQVEDFSGMTMAEYAEYREGRVKDMGQVRGLEAADNPIERGRQLATWFQRPELPDAMQQHAEARQEQGIRDATDFLGVGRRDPRVNETPYGPGLRRSGN